MSAQILLLLIFASQASAAPTPRYQFKADKSSCLNDRGSRGLNKGYLGECGDLSYATLDKSPMDWLKEIGARSLNGLNLYRSTLKQVWLPGLQLKKASFREVNAIPATNKNLPVLLLSDSNLTEASFYRARVPKAYFQFSNLTRADFREADLSGSFLEAANLDGTNFTGADLRGANLRTAKISDTTVFDGAKFDASTVLPFDSATAARLGMVFQAR